jgi:hypothetical protein
VQEDETLESKVAVTLLAAVIDRVQVLDEPLHAPPHAVNVLPLVAAAVSVTLVPDDKLAEQVLPQEMPPTLLVTVPDPVPTLLTDNVYELATAVKVAVTDRAEDMATTQVLEVPEQPPPQPAKVDPPLATAVNVTLDPDVKAAEQALLGQVIPAAELVTEPEPVPLTETVRVFVLDALELALAVEAPPPPPPQPTNTAASSAISALGKKAPRVENLVRADMRESDTENPGDSDEQMCEE